MNESLVGVLVYHEKELKAKVIRYSIDRSSSDFFEIVACTYVRGAGVRTVRTSLMSLIT